MTPLHRSAATALLSVLLVLPAVVRPGFAQEDGPPPQEAPEEVQEKAPEAASAVEASPEEVSPGEAPEDGAAGDPEVAAEDEDSAPETEAARAARQVSPEAQAKAEAARRKREERLAERQAKRDLEKEKAEDKAAMEKAKRQEQLAKMLEKAYEALDAERYKNALELFGNQLELEDGMLFEAHMGLARTLFAMDEKAAAVEEALKAAAVAERDPDRSEALVFAGDLTLRSAPRDETTSTPLPGAELYETTAWRYYLQAIRADPEGAEEARQRLDEIFPTPPDERTERLYRRYVELLPEGRKLYAERLAGAYEALISGPSSAPVVVAGGISPPVKTSGRRPTYPQPASGQAPARLMASFVVEADGTVSQVKVLNGISTKLDQGASEIFATWTFEPARLPNGTPLRVHYLAGASPIVIEAIADDGSEDPSDEGVDDDSEDLPDEGDSESDQ